MGSLLRRVQFPSSPFDSRAVARIDSVRAINAAAAVSLFKGIARTAAPVALPAAACDRAGVLRCLMPANGKVTDASARSKTLRNAECGLRIAEFETGSTNRYVPIR